MMSELNDLLKDINHVLQFDYNIRDRYDRVFYTASLLVGLSEKDYDVSPMDTPDVSRVRQLFKNERQKDYGVTDDVKNNLTDKINQLYNFVNSDDWQGIDLMGMMSSQFVSNKGKSDNGQVFTPHHIAQLMADVIDIKPGDVVLDAAAGDGALLTEALHKNTETTGIEIDSKVFTLLVANMLIRKGNWSRLYKSDMLTDEGKQIVHHLSYDDDGNEKPNAVTKIMLNPPYEKSFHPIDIINNIFDNVKPGVEAAVLLPDRKLEKEGKKKVRHLLTNNRLVEIIKLPENVFAEGVAVSLFVFITGETTKDQEAYTVNLKDDGLETVKNGGRQDIHHKWSDIESKLLEIVKNRDEKAETAKIIKPDLKNLENLSWPVPVKPFEISSQDFMKTIMDYEMFKQGVDVKKLRERIADAVLYDSEIAELNNKILIELPLKTYKKTFEENRKLQEERKMLHE